VTTVRSYSLANKVARVLWGTVYLLLFRFSPRLCHPWRALLLRCFRARIGDGCHIYGAAKIWAPWNLECGRNAAIADGVEIYNPARVLVDEGAIISQQVYLCSATHDYLADDFPILVAPIHVGKKAWIAARSIVLPGVTIGDGCVVGAGSVVTKSTPPHTVCAGNPATVIKDIRREGEK
jgi:putative colanic acid biosynthesis acetyltransferase WcaF